MIKDNKPYTVYHLFDGMEQETCYIGVTGDFKKRWLKHISKSRQPKSDLYTWLQSRIQNNETVYMISIETVVGKILAYDRERYWIEYYIKSGARLFNDPLYHRHFYFDQSWPAELIRA